MTACSLRRSAYMSIFVFSFYLASTPLCFGEDDSITARFESLRNQYNAFSTLSLQADVSIHNLSAEGSEETKKGTYECYLRKEKYRIIANVDDGIKFDNAYDGNRYQLFDRPDCRLMISKSKHLLRPFVMNPVVVPILFLVPKSTTKLPSMYQVNDINNDDNWKRVLASARVYKDDTNSDSFIVDITDQSENGGSFVTRVSFGKEPYFLPKQITWIENGVEISNCFIGTYKCHNMGNKKFYWPESYAIASKHHGKDHTDLEVKVNRCDIGREVTDDKFTIDFGLAETIWDDDFHTLLKQKGGGRFSNDAINTSSTYMNRNPKAIDKIGENNHTTPVENTTRPRTKENIDVSPSVSYGTKCATWYYWLLILVPAILIVGFLINRYKK